MYLKAFKLNPSHLFFSVHLPFSFYIISPTVLYFPHIVCIHTAIIFSGFPLYFLTTNVTSFELHFRCHQISLFSECSMLESNVFEGLQFLKERPCNTPIILE